jgi:hypothetical protein
VSFPFSFSEVVIERTIYNQFCPLAVWRPIGKTDTR